MTSTTAPARRRRIPKRAAALAVVVAGATTFTVAMASPASADPTGTYAAVGSDTVQDVENGLANALGGGLIASYNAFDPANLGTDGNAATRTTGALNILTKPGTKSIPRPNGSGDGVAALAAAQGGTVQDKSPYNTGVTPGSIDIARSSSGPSGFTLADGHTAVTTGSSGIVDFIPFAVDAVTFAAGPNSILGANAKLLTLQNLKDLFGGGFDVTVNGTVYHPAGGVGTSSPATGSVPTPGTATTLDLYVPQNGSGTLKFWASTTGFTATSIPGYDHQTETSTGAHPGVQVEEHDGSVLADDPAGIAPFSIAQWIAQSKATLNSDGTANPSAPTNPVLQLKDVSNRRHGAIIEPISAVNPTTSSSGGVPTGNLNTTFPVVREVYNVITKASLAGDAQLSSIFVSASATSPSLLCGNTSVISKYGFGLLTGSASLFAGDYCGDTANPSLQAFTTAQW
jgi:hypothetical protein